MRAIGLLSKIAEKASKRVSAYGAQYSATAIFFIVFYISNPLKWQFSGPYNTTTILVLRLSSVILILALAVWRFWPKRLKPYLPLFWLFVLFKNLPFRTTFTILNSANSHSYAAYGVLGFVVLAVLVDNILYVWMTILGVLCGVAVYYLGGGYELPLIPLSTIAQATYMVVTISFIKLVFFRNHNMRLESQISSYKTLAGAIAHEIRGPLSTINVTCQKFEVNPLHSNPEPIITIGRLNRKVLSIIDTILLQLKFLESKRAIERKRINLLECIMEACENPVFSDAERSLISLDIAKEESVKGDKRLLSQVFTNLIRNSLHAIKHSPNGQIRIAAVQSVSHVSLTIHDNGAGISKLQQQNLFKPFFSMSKNGIGLGLAFSKLALESIGGSIACESKEGSFTCFTITLKSPQAKRK